MESKKGNQIHFSSDSEKKKHRMVHFLGIGGSGASAVASIAQSQGWQVTGCDLNPQTEFTTNFDPKILSTGHSKEHLKNVNVLAVTPAIYSLDPNNQELEFAKKQGVEILTWQQFLAKYLANGKQIVAVCGTHGKSTTTAMVGKILKDAGFDPTVELGAIVSGWGSNFRVGQGKYLVVEADEFNDNFLSFRPQVTIITSVEMDHPEYFADFSAYKNSFRKFLSQTKKLIIANLSDPAVSELVTTLETPVKAIDYSSKLIDFSLQVPGNFNRLNASAAYQVGVALGVDPKVAKASLSSYQGSQRRFELIGNFRQAAIYSDFAHHPTEVKLTLEAAREKFPNQKIRVVFQPHMFSRTLGLFSDFVKVLKNLPVDQIIILDIYPSREIDRGLISSKQLVEAINEKSVLFLTPEQAVLDYLKTDIQSNEVVFFLGAGNTDKLAKQLVSLSAS